MYTTADKEGTV